MSLISRKENWTLHNGEIRSLLIVLYLTHKQIMLNKCYSYLSNSFCVCFCKCIFIFFCKTCHSIISLKQTNKQTHTKKPKQFHCELLWQGRRGRLYCSPNPYLLGFISHKNENKNHHSGLGFLMMNPKLAGCMVTTNPFK